MTARKASTLALVGECDRSSLPTRLAKSCDEELEQVSAANILARLQAQAPELELRYAMERAGWYRLGGVVDVEHRRVAKHIRDWAEEQSTGGIDVLMERCQQIGGYVTRLVGRTHYITARTGDCAKDFIQIEVEQLQEVIERPLWNPDWWPDDLEEFVDPLDFPRLEPEPVGSPYLVFRRLVDVSEFMDSEDASTNIKRFLDDWDRSSAGESTTFCHHWCFSFRDFQGTQHDSHRSAKPIPVPCGETPDLSDRSVARGAALANRIHGFDRHCGYNFAWFFHMLTERRVSFGLAEAVHSDLMGAFDYLTGVDIAVLRDWYDAPYSV